MTVSDVTTSENDADLIRLADDLRAAWSRQRSLEHSGNTEEFEAAHQRCTEVADQIEQCIATTMNGLRVKAIAILWYHGGDMELKLHEDQTRDIRLAQSIIRDLLP